MTDSTELYYAEMEAARNEAERAYFAARPNNDNRFERKAFRDGFERAFQGLWKALPTATHEQPTIAAPEDPTVADLIAFYAEGNFAKGALVRVPYGATRDALVRLQQSTSDQAGNITRLQRGGV